MGGHRHQRSGALRPPAYTGSTRCYAAQRLTAGQPVERRAWWRKQMAEWKSDSCDKMWRETNRRRGRKRRRWQAGKKNERMNKTDGEIRVKAERKALHKHDICWWFRFTLLRETEVFSSVFNTIIAPRLVAVRDLTWLWSSVQTAIAVHLQCRTSTGSNAAEDKVPSFLSLHYFLSQSFQKSCFIIWTVKADLRQEMVSLYNILKSSTCFYSHFQFTHEKL